MTERQLVAVYGMNDNSVHGEDHFEVDQTSGSPIVIAVADGVSESRSRDIARTVVTLALKTYREDVTRAWSEYCGAFLQALHDESKYEPPKCEGRTTLTLLWIESDSNTTVTARYLAIGDSPIYLAYRGPIMDLYPDTFLVHAVHRKPLAVQNPARVYSYVDLACHGGIVGRAVSGSIGLNNGDICLVCTDGLPFSRILDDLTLGNTSHKFLNSVQEHGPELATTRLFDVLRDVELLDDATLVTVSVEAPDESDLPSCREIGAARATLMRNRASIENEGIEENRSETRPRDPAADNMKQAQQDSIRSGVDEG